jgi:hypothetical protein
LNRVTSRDAETDRTRPREVQNSFGVYGVGFTACNAALSWRPCSNENVFEQVRPNPQGTFSLRQGSTGDVFIVLTAIALDGVKRKQGQSYLRAAQNG